MKSMDIDVCVKYLINAYKVSPGKDPESCMECLCCLNPSLKDDKPTLNAIYGCFLEWWFTRRDWQTIDLAHRVKRIMDYWKKVQWSIYEDEITKAREFEIVIDGLRFNALILRDILESLIENGLLKTIDR